MSRAFEVVKNGKPYDYRVGVTLDLTQISQFFQHRGYDVLSCTHGARHALVRLSKNNMSFFAKVATSQGINILTENEAQWNNQFHKLSADTRFVVPENIETGYMQIGDAHYFYLVTTELLGYPLVDFQSPESAEGVTERQWEKVIDLSEYIQSLFLTNIGVYEVRPNEYAKWFVEKARRWYEAIPKDVQQTHSLATLLEMVIKGEGKLACKPRHGDFAPWHILQLSDGRFGLLDGEHAMAYAVEYYDICYLVQRVFGALKKPDTAKKIYDLLLQRAYIKEKMQLILAARAIGGFLDESFSAAPDYLIHQQFSTWVLSQ